MQKAGRVELEKESAFEREIRDLVLSAKNRDESAMAALLTNAELTCRVKKIVERFCVPIRKKFGIAVDTEDLVQEIKIKVWRNLNSFRGECLITTWVFRIALRDFLVQKKKAEKLALVTIDGILDTAAVTDGRIVNFDFKDSFEKLSKQDQKIIWMRHCGYTFFEIAKEFGFTTKKSKELSKQKAERLFEKALKKLMKNYDQQIA